MTITYDAASRNYIWSNKAGVKWRLYASSVTGELKVGNGCPYYKSGHVVARFTEKGVFGPWIRVLHKRMYV